MLLARRLFLFSSLILTGCLLSGAAKVNLAAVPIARMDLPWWKHRFEEKQARLREGHVDLIFLGDSITQQWEDDGPEPWKTFAPIWQRMYGDRNAVNLGFTGDTTANLLWREMHGELDGIHPKAAVVLIGANNLGRLHWGTKQTIEGIETDVAEIRRRLPDTKILLISILPSIRSAWASETTLAVNKALAARYAQDEVVRFIDVSHLFMNSGKVDPDLFIDPKETPPRPPLHPTAQTQARIAEAIEPTLAAMLGDARHTASR